eukprot:11566-Heterococcus_DN1.PRE.1
MKCMRAVPVSHGVSTTVTALYCVLYRLRATSVLTCCVEASTALCITGFWHASCAQVHDGSAILSCVSTSAHQQQQCVRSVQAKVGSTEFMCAVIAFNGSVHCKLMLGV